MAANDVFEIFDGAAALDSVPDNEFEIDPMEEEELPLLYDEDDTNLVFAFSEHPEGKKALKKIADKVIRDFEAAYDGSEEYRQRYSDNWRLFAGDLPPKDWPFEDSANAHVPIMMENLTRIHARLMSEIFGDWTNIFGVTPTGPDDNQIADDLTLHGNWQMREGIPDMFRQMDRALLSFLLGDVVVHSYWDEELRMNRHEVCTPDEFFLPYTHVSTMPDLSDCPWRVKVLHWHRHQLQAMRGRWSDVDTVIKREKPTWDDEPEDRLRLTVGEVQGIVPEEETGAPFKLYQFEGWDDGLLPNQEKDRFIQAIVDPKTRAVLSLQIHEEPDWRDKERYRQQTEELAGFRQAQQHYATAVQTSEILGAVAPPLMGIMPQQLPPPPPPPTPPMWLDDPSDLLAEPEKPRRVPVHMFTHGVCIEPLTAVLGIGYGQIQADYTRAANVALSQFIDAATLSNAWTLLTTESVQFKEPFEFGPGKINQVSGIGPQELDSSIKELKAHPANGQLLTVVDKCYGYGQSSMQAPDVLSGAPGKSGETYRGLSARIEQATKQLTAGGRKFSTTVVKPTIVNNARLNAIFLPDFEIQRILDWRSGENRPVPISRSLYERSYQFELRADLRFASEAQRIQEANELVAMSTQHPMLAAMPAFQYYAMKKLLEARRDYDMVPLLGPPPPPGLLPPPPPPGAPAPGGPPSAPPTTR
jgi:hypothetical protein